MNEFESRFGRLLYDLLPAVYRERDNTQRDANLNVIELGDMARYLDALGILLDRLRATLDQRLADAFPDNPLTGRACQDWLIPYFAHLLDVRLVSPDIGGQRDEVAHAVRWRQGKGTLVTAEEIGESVTRAEVELQEGWRRVAVTPRVGLPLLPASVYGVMRLLDSRSTSQFTQHPGIPAATVDLRCISRAVTTDVVSPAVKESRLGGARVRWMQANPHGTPAAPGSFDDVSRRTADLRTPTMSYGHAHPRRLLVYAPAPWGLFAPPEEALASTALQSSAHVSWVLDASSAELHIRNVSDRPVVVSGDLQLPPVGSGVERVTLEGLQFSGRVTLTHGVLVLVHIVATEIAVQTAFYAPERPVLDATDSLLGTIRVPDGYARLERCTVRRDAICGAVLARNSLFHASLADADGNRPAAGEIRHCRIPADFADLPDPAGGSTLFVDTPSCTTDPPALFASRADDDAQPITPDAAVLTPNCAESILFGADDGGELGVYHAGRADRPVALSEEQQLELTRPHPYVLRDLVFAASVTISPGAQQPLVLERVAMSDLHVQSDPRTADTAPEPVLNARSSLFDTLSVTPGLARLEYCTVLGAATFAAVQASDCIFAGTLMAGGPGNAPRAEDCLRYSRLPPAVLALAGAGGVRLPFCTDAVPVFFEGDFARAVGGSPGGAVLHPAAPSGVSSGAEDGGELGAYHERRDCLGRAAVADKLAEHLPVGLEPVLIPDKRLHVAPIAARTS